MPPHRQTHSGGCGLLSGHLLSLTPASWPFWDGIEAAGRSQTIQVIQARSPEVGPGQWAMLHLGHVSAQHCSSQQYCGLAVTMREDLGMPMLDKHI